MAIIHQIRKRYSTPQEETIADLLYGVGSATDSDLEKMIKCKAAEISYLMALKHGGDWRVEVNHQAGFVLIAPRPPAPRKS